MNVDSCAGMYAGVNQCLGQRLIGISQAGVFADHGDIDRAGWMLHSIDDTIPIGQICIPGIDGKPVYHDVIQPLLMKQTRDHEQVMDVYRGNNGPFIDVGKQGYLAAFVLRQGTVGTTEQYVRLDTD